MTEKQFEFGVDIPNSWKQKTMKNERRFTDSEGFLDEDYDGEHHMLWDNQKECWIHLDDALCLMEKQYREIKEENEQLNQFKDSVFDLIDKNIKETKELFEEGRIDLISYNSAMITLTGLKEELKGDVE